MAISQASFPTPHARKYMKQLVGHWGHRFPVTHTPYEGWVPFSREKVCKLDAEDDVLRIRLSVADESRLPGFESMVEEHLRRFAFREDLPALQWLRGTGEDIPPFVEEEEHDDFGSEPTGELRDWTIRVGGRAVVLTYAEGPGDALLLFHGLGGSARSFAPVMAAFEEAGYRPIAVNMPGYGGSDPLRQDYPTPQELAAHIRGIMDEIALQQADVLGHSLGGVLAASLAHYHPERVGRMVLSSPPLGFGLGEPDTWPESMTRRVADLEEEGPVLYAQKRAAGLCSSAGASDEAVAMVREQMERLTPEGLRTASSLFARANLRGLLAGTDVPLHFLSAERDRIVPAEVVNEHAAATGGQVTLLAGVGHAGYCEDPGQFTKAALAALAQLPAPRAAI